MSLLSVVLLGLLTVASIVQALLLARTMTAGRQTSRRLAVLEGDSRLTRSLRSADAHTATLDTAEVLSPRSSPGDPSRLERQGPELPASKRPVRFVGGLNQ